MPIPHIDRETGYEHKSLRAVIENWLYNQDVRERIRASAEVRKRFTKTFPTPSWVKEQT